MFAPFVNRFLNRFVNRFRTALLMAFVMLFASLAPTLSHALARLDGSPYRLVEACTTQGVKIFAVAPDGSVVDEVPAPASARWVVLAALDSNTANSVHCLRWARRRLPMSVSSAGSMSSSSCRPSSFTRRARRTSGCRRPLARHP